MNPKPQNPKTPRDVIKFEMETNVSYIISIIIAREREKLTNMSGSRDHFATLKLKRNADEIEVDTA